MIPLTFTTTATPRPELLDRTYESFRRRLAHCDFDRSRLLINVDPFPDRPADRRRAACVAVAQRYFGSVEARLPETPNFPLALKWLWESTGAEVVFHLEDDWELVEPIDLHVLLKKLDSGSCDHVMLRAWRWHSYPFCLAPGILHKRLYRRCAGVLTPSLNPEVALRAALVKGRYVGLVLPESRERVVLRDLGRTWMQKTGYIRGPGDFVVWERETLENRHHHACLADQNRELLNPEGS